MPMLDEHHRPYPPEEAGELDTLVGLLEFQRATFEWKCSDLDEDQMNQVLAPSPMTLGGLMKHLALVEEHWLSRRLHARPRSAPWDAVDWDADRDWDWHSAVHDTPDELRALWRRSVARSQSELQAALETGDLSQRVEDKMPGDSPNLRWVLCHMIAEYARHNGHADLLREAVDGLVGE